jgi:hypothetical protein
MTTTSYQENYLVGDGDHGPHFGLNSLVGVLDQKDDLLHSQQLNKLNPGQFPAHKLLPIDHMHAHKFARSIYGYRLACLVLKSVLHGGVGAMFQVHGGREGHVASR